MSKVTWSKPTRSSELWSRRSGRGPAWSCWIKWFLLQAVSGRLTLFNLCTLPFTVELNASSSVCWSIQRFIHTFVKCGQKCFWLDAALVRKMNSRWGHSLNHYVLRLCKINTPVLALCNILLKIKLLWASYWRQLRNKKPFNRLKHSAAP